MCFLFFVIFVNTFVTLLDVSAVNTFVIPLDVSAVHTFVTLLDVRTSNIVVDTCPRVVYTIDSGPGAHLRSAAGGATSGQASCRSLYNY